MIYRLITFINNLITRWELNRVPEGKRMFIVFWSGEEAHVERKIRGVPIPGKITFLKATGKDYQKSNYSIDVIGLERFTMKKCKELGITDGYYVDGRYNDLKIKRIK